MSNFASFIICTAPRSGSTMLCKMLAATGVAGNPNSYFYRPNLEDWQKRLGVAGDGVAGGFDTQTARIAALIKAAMTLGRGDTPMFGLRQQQAGFGFLCEMLAVLYPNQATDRARISAAFGPTFYIHLTRENKLEQAISHVIADQTGLWHRNADGSELERLSPPRAPWYDRDGISKYITQLSERDAAWRDWFRSQGIAPFAITYEELALDPRGVLAGLLGEMGLDRAAADAIAPLTAKLSDGVNRAWAERYAQDVTGVAD